MSRVNEALKKFNVRNARVTNTGTLVVQVSSENGRDDAFSRLEEGLSNSYVVEGGEMLLSTLTVVGIPSDLPGNEFISDICEKV